VEYSGGCGDEGIVGGGAKMRGQKSVPELCHKMIRRLRAYVLVGIDGADNVKVAGDVRLMGKPVGEIQEMFAAMVGHLQKGAIIMQEMAQRRRDSGKQERLVEEAKEKRSEELGGIFHDEKADSGL
jgi:hypothetical protein